MSANEGIMIDLTIDSDAEEEFIAIADLQIIEGIDETEKPAIDIPAYPPTEPIHEEQVTAGTIVQEAPLTFASREIKSLSRKRMEATRFSDLLQRDQYAGQHHPQHRQAFLAHIQENDKSTASLRIVNDVDWEPCPKADFEYTMEYIVHKDLGPATLRFDEDLTVPSRCSCDPFDGCDPRTCECRMLHRQRAPTPWNELPIMFAYNEYGRLREHVLMYNQVPLWECTKLCSCRGDCFNTVVGNGRTVDITLFKTIDKGWGIRTDRDLKAGQFIDIYVGELIGEKEAGRRAEIYDTRLQTSYLLDLDPFHIAHEMCTKPYKRLIGDEAAAIIERREEGADSLQALALDWYATQYPDRDVDLVVDAGLWGNLSRFFNHSCEPNMKLYPVYTHERDLRRPFWAFFTIRAVAENEELTWDYKCESVDESEVKEKTGSGQSLDQMKCSCGSNNCRGTVWTGRRQG